MGAAHKECHGIGCDGCVDGGFTPVEVVEDVEATEGGEAEVEAAEGDGDVVESEEDPAVD